MYKKNIKNIAVIGLGTVGMPTAEYIYRKGFNVWGYDLVKKSKKLFPIYTEWNNLPHEKIDVYVITIWIGLNEDGFPKLDPMYELAKRISEYNSEALISIESTIPVGLSRFLAEKYNLKHIIHVPHRYWPSDPEKYGVNQTRVFGALNEESKYLGLDYYKKLGIPVFIVDPIEIAEISKLAENSYRYVQISFAEQLKIICDELNLDFELVRKASNTKWNINILEARDGIRGSCLPKDIKFLMGLVKHKTLLKAAVKQDEEYRQWIKNIKE